MTDGPPRPAAADEEAEEGGWGPAPAAEDGEADADGGAGGGPPLDPALAAINRADVRLGLLQVCGGREGTGWVLHAGWVRVLVRDGELLYGGCGYVPVPSMRFAAGADAGGVRAQGGEQAAG